MQGHYRAAAPFKPYYFPRRRRDPRGGPVIGQQIRSTRNSIRDVDEHFQRQLRYYRLTWPNEQFGPGHFHYDVYATEHQRLIAHYEKELADLNVELRVLVSQHKRKMVAVSTSLIDEGLPREVRELITSYAGGPMNTSVSQFVGTPVVHAPKVKGQTWGGYASYDDYCQR